MIDKRVKSETLFDLVRSVLLPKPVKTEFLYPSYGGFGTFCDKLAEQVQERGGQILLGNTLRSIRTEASRAVEVELADGRKLKPRYIVWSGNLKSLAGLLGQEPPGIRYLSTVLFNIEVSSNVLQSQQWIYYGSQDTVLSRVSITNEMADYMAPAGTAGLCVEVTTFEGEGCWNAPETLIPEIQSDLVRLKLVRSEADFSAVHVERVRDTYPIYDLDYKKNFDAVFVAFGCVDRQSIHNRKNVIFRTLVCELSFCSHLKFTSSKLEICKYMRSRLLPGYSFIRILIY